MPVMITSSCWPWGTGGSVRFLDDGLGLAAREAARFFEAMVKGLSCGQRLSDFSSAVSRSRVPPRCRLALLFGACLRGPCRQATLIGHRVLSFSLSAHLKIKSPANQITSM